MTDEALVAIEAIRGAGGSGRIAVGDWHMVGTNIERDRVPGAEVRPIAELALVEAEPSMSKAHGGPLDAVVFIGHHASTRNRRGFCSHTFVWEMEVTLDGEPLNEVQVYAQGLAAEGIPVLVASGDRWMLEELGEGELGGARLVPTKEGQGRARARSYDLRSTRAELADAIAASPGGPAGPAAGSRLSGRAADRGRRRGAGPRRTVASAADLLVEIATVFRTSPEVAREYRQLARLLPAMSSVARRGGPTGASARGRHAGDARQGAQLAQGRRGLRLAPSPRVASIPPRAKDGGDRREAGRHRPRQRRDPRPGLRHVAGEDEGQRDVLQEVGGGGQRPEPGDRRRCHRETGPAALPGPAGRRPRRRRRERGRSRSGRAYRRPAATTSRSSPGRPTR